MRIALLSPPYVPEYMRNARCDFVSLSAAQWYPILLGYCGVTLEGRGHEARLIDAPAHGLDHEATARLLRELRPELLVLYTGRMSEENDLAFGNRVVAETGCDAVIVGPFASIDPVRTLSAAGRITKLVVREFDAAVAELADGRPPEEIGNLVRRTPAGACESNPLRPCLSGADLDALPFVSRFFARELDLSRYRVPSEPFPYLDILTGRGCQWGRCTYCLWVHTFIPGSAYQVRSVENVVEEFRAIATELPQVRSVMLQDDTFTEARAAAFSEAKLAAGIRLPWSCYSRGNLGLDTLRLMKRAGCRNLHVGYESGDDEVLRRIRKGVTVERMTKFTDDAHRAGLRIHGDFAFGFPGETPEKALRTIAWACRLDPYTAQFQLLIPFPGTACHAEMREHGWLNERGEPDLPGFPNEEIREMAKRAYRRFYFRGAYYRRCLLHPHDLVFSRLKTIRRAIPAIFWQRWRTT
jgi:radical SAM superfamily enzyme YgiQ (UPF0313 family)